jgi:pimeloyl-ACP methyl ester carboxylesterase
MHETLGDVAARLASALRATGGPAHVVAHSLGGIIALEALEAAPGLPSGRAVLLGSPVLGSRAARAIAGWAIGPRILGGLGVSELARARERRWLGAHEVGLIAGSRSAGLGRLFASLPSPNDGTVCAEETALGGAKSRILLDVSHTGMLFSRAVAQATARFLATGRFEPGDYA